MKIVVDSGCDLNDEVRARLEGTLIESVPLTLTLDGRDYLDTGELDVASYLSQSERAASVTTAAPSPQRFLKAFEGAHSVFVVALSSRLSGTFESASLAARMRTEKVKDRLTHVFDSLSASVGETLVALEIARGARQRLSDNTLIEHTERFIANMRTYFILDRFDTVVKTGRMAPAVARLAGLLNIKPICAGVEGEMAVVAKARGYRKAVARLIKIIRSQPLRFEERTLAISHCDCEDKARALQEEIMGQVPFGDSLLLSTGGLCSTYAARGGIILAY